MYMPNFYLSDLETAIDKYKNVSSQSPSGQLLGINNQQ